jgi:hypothetical protein
MATAGDYAGWGWEQVLTGVLGIPVPDRAQVTGQPWLIVRHDTSAVPGMHLIYTATRNDPDGGGQSIQVYLDPAVYAPGGAWDGFSGAPQVFSGVPAGNYGALPVRPPSFGVAAASVASVTSWLAAKTVQFSGMHQAMMSPSSPVKGSAALVLADLMDHLGGATNRFHQQLTSPVIYSDAIGAAGDSASTFLSGLWSAYTAWTQQPGSSPLGALVTTVQAAAAAPDPANTSYGDLLADATWGLIESDAKTGWSEVLTVGSGGFAGLDPLSQAALGRLVAQYESAAHAIDPLLGPQLRTRLQPGPPPPAGPGAGRSTTSFLPGGPGPKVPGGAVPAGIVPNMPPGAVPPPSAIPVTPLPGAGQPGAVSTLAAVSPAAGPAGTYGLAGALLMPAGVNVIGGPVQPESAIPNAGSVPPAGTNVLTAAAPAGGAVPGIAPPGIAPPQGAIASLAGAQAGLLLPAALLVSRAGERSGGRGRGGARRGSMVVSELAGAADPPGLAGSIGRPVLSAPADNSVLADGAVNAPAGPGLAAPAAGFSLGGSSPGGSVLQMSVVPRLATQGGPPVTSASVNLQTVPQAPVAGTAAAGETAGGRVYAMPPMMPGAAGGQNTERVRQAFAAENRESWGTAPTLPGAPVGPDDPSAPDPRWPDSDPGPFTATGIGAGGTEQASTTPDRRTR